MSRSTPGPWLLERLESGNYRRIGPLYADDANHWDRICIVAGEDDAQADANARLIAAAPELLKACRLGLELLDKLREPADFQMAGGMDMILGAIRKAEGHS